MTAIREDFHTQPWLYDIWQAFVLLDEEAEGGRYSVPASLEFAPADIEGMDEADGGAAKKLRLTLPGLLGPIGPAPMHLVESAVRQKRLGNNALQDFLDLFHHHFLRLWREQALALCPELGPAQGGQRDDIDTVWLLSVAGMLTAGLRHNPIAVPSRSLWLRPSVEIPDAAFFLHASLWRVFPHGCEGFRRLVRSCLGLDVEVDPFAGTWVEIPKHRRCRLGGEEGARRLGQTAIIGSRAFHDAAGVRIRPGDASHNKAFTDPQTRDTLAALFIGYAGTDLRMELAPPEPERARRTRIDGDIILPIGKE